MSEQETPIEDKINSLINAALVAINPVTAIQNYLHLEGDKLTIFDRQNSGAVSIYNLADKDIRCVAIGKGAVPMAQAIDSLFGDRIDRGLVVTNSLENVEFPANWQAIESAHPVPDARSLAAGDLVWELLADCTEQTLVLACISGGASAVVVAPRLWQVLIELSASQPTAEITQATTQLIRIALLNDEIDLDTINPAVSISLTALQAIGNALLSSGLSIVEINAVRSTIDRLKGGGLVERVGAGRVIGLILSDVIGDPIASIASGLTHHPKAANFLIGNNHQACEAVASNARAMGYDAQIVTTELDGEARVRGAEIARDIITRPSQTVLIYGGETTVSLPAHCQGIGGRNQELGLAAAIELAIYGIPAWVTTLATDGLDGPTEAAGVTVNELTIARALALGLNPQLELDRHNSYTFFDRLGNLRQTGATGTNVADITIAIAP